MHAPGRRQRGDIRKHPGGKKGGVLVRFAGFLAVASLVWGQAIEQAKRAFDRGEYASALRLFEQARGTSPSCNLSFYIGLTQYRLNQTSEALIAFQSAVDCDPKLIDAHLAMAAAYSERRNDTEALRAYQRVLALDGGNTRRSRARPASS